MIRNLSVKPKNIEILNYATNRVKSFKAEDRAFSTIKQNIGKNENLRCGVLMKAHPRRSNVSLYAITDLEENDCLPKDINIPKDVLDKLKDWFSHLKIKDFESLESLKEKIQEFICGLNKELVANNKDTIMMATLNFAIVVDNHTLVVNIGDNYIYIKNGGRISKSIEINRSVYDKRTNYLGNPFFQKANIKILENNLDYDLLLMVSNGVKLGLEDFKLESLINSREIGDLTKVVVKLAQEDSETLKAYFSKQPKKVKIKSSFGALAIKSKRI